MSTTNDGGPAFPSDFIELPKSGFSKGMSLRDYFAAAALSGMLGNPDVDHCDLYTEHANYAYQHADAMLKARKAK